MLKSLKVIYDYVEDSDKVGLAMQNHIKVLNDVLTHGPVKLIEGSDLEESMQLIFDAESEFEEDDSEVENEAEEEDDNEEEIEDDTSNEDDDEDEDEEIDDDEDDDADEEYDFEDDDDEVEATR